MNRKAETLTPQLARRMGQALMRRLADAGNAGDASADAGVTSPVLVEPAATPTAPALLAARHPGGPQAQRQAKAMYQRCLTHYRAHIQQGRAPDDVAAAAAWFVAANLEALHGQAVGIEQIAAVERQLRAVIAGHDGWHAASLQERQSLFEQLATLGVLVGETQAQARTQGPAAIANVQRAARGYLLQLLGVDADALQLSPDGLAARVTMQA